MIFAAAFRQRSVFGSASPRTTPWSFDDLQIANDQAIVKRNRAEGGRSLLSSINLIRTSVITTVVLPLCCGTWTFKGLKHLNEPCSETDVLTNSRRDHCNRGLASSLRRRRVSLPLQIGTAKRACCRCRTSDVPRARRREHPLHIARGVPTAPPPSGSGCISLPNINVTFHESFSNCVADVVAAARLRFVHSGGRHTESWASSTK